MTDTEYVDAMGQILTDSELTDCSRVYRIMCLLELDKVTAIRRVLQDDIAPDLIVASIQGVING